MVKVAGDQVVVDNKAVVGKPIRSAVILAIPMIVFGGGPWLENYAYRIDVGLDLIVIPGMCLLMIALFTVSYRTYTAANTNPVDSLKSE